MRVDILSLFPEYFSGPFEQSIIKRARSKGLLDIQLTDIRNFSEDRHQRVDDRPFGGGPGMVMMPQPVTKAIRSVKNEKSHVIFLSPQGTPLTAQKCRELADKKHLILLCGHYEGVDQRIIDSEVDEEISIGDYVLTNGCLSAIVLVDAMSRFIPGVLGHEDAAGQDSFEEGLLDCPHYTRPEVFEDVKVPAVLLEGNHDKIKTWRHAAALDLTRQRRPDLWLYWQAKQKDVGQQTKKTKKHGFWQVCEPEKLNTVYLSVKDIQISIKFYRDILGAAIVLEGQHCASFKIGSQTFVLVQGKAQADTTKEHINSLPISFELGTSDTQILQAAVKWVNSKAIGQVVRNEEEQLTAVTIKDPDGYQWILRISQGVNS